MTSRRWCILLDFLQQNVNLILNLQVHAGFVNKHSDTSIIYATEKWLASLYGWTNWSGNTHYMTIVTRVNNRTEWLDDHPDWLKRLYFSGDWVTAPGLRDSRTHSLTHSLYWLTDHVVLNFQPSTLPKQKPITLLHVELIQSYPHTQIQVAQCQFQYHYLISTSVFHSDINTMSLFASRI